MKIEYFVALYVQNGPDDGEWEECPCHTNFETEDAAEEHAAIHKKRGFETQIEAEEAPDRPSGYEGSLL